MKIETYVRFPNESAHYTKILVNPKQIKNPVVFLDEVFVTIDNTRVAISKMEWEKINKKIV